MTTLTVERPSDMAKAKKSEQANPPTKAVKIDRVLAGKAEMIAKDNGVSLSDYLSSIVRAAIERDWGKMLRRMDERAAGE